MKRNYAFVEFSDPRDADDARYGLYGRDLDGSRITVEFSTGAPRGPGGSLVLGAKGMVPGSGRCYRCGERGHIVRNCQNSPMKLKRGRSYSRSPSPRRGRSRSRSLSRIYSRSRSSRKRARVVEHSDRSRSPVCRKRRVKHSPTPKPDERRSPGGKASLSHRDVGRHTNGSDYGLSRSPVGRSKSPAEVGRESPRERKDNSSMEANGGWGGS